ncbi:MAG: SPOR domain-containing protein [Proteobacteria bacterium]|jgi:hypothetical protein|nr:SPOR domain-containing protein [Pseudomonadota bacterium]
MNEKQKKTLMIAGIAAGALILILILLLVLWPKKAPVRPAPAPVAAAPKPVTAPVVPVAPIQVTKTINYAHDNYRTKPGDTLWDIAKRPEVYGNPELWWYLVEPNEEIISYIYQKPSGRWIAYVLPDKDLIIPREKYTPQEKISQYQRNLVTYAVDLGTYSSQAEANALQIKLRNDVYSAYIAPAANGVSLRIGFFTNRKLADFVGNEVTKKYPELKSFQVAQPGQEEIQKCRDELRKFFANKMKL